MEIDKAVLAFSQSEKIKAGIIWATQVINALQGLVSIEQKGAEKIVENLIRMISMEASLARSMTNDEQWDKMEPHMEKAILMINSGVSQEAMIHLSKALSNVTTIGQRAMTILKENGLL